MISIFSGSSLGNVQLCQVSLLWDKCGRFYGWERTFYSHYFSVDWEDELNADNSIYLD